MTPVISLTELDQTIAAVRRRADAYVTNLYADRPSLEKWIADRSLTLLNDDDCALLLRRRDGFSQLYFAASNKTTLGQAITQSLSEIARPTIADLVGPAASIESVSSLFKSHGFAMRERLIRMSVAPPLKRSADAKCQTSTATLARESDIDWILQALSADFDPCVDQFPSREELAGSISDRQVLTCHLNDQLAGFVLFSRNGSTTNLKYWYVSPAARGSGVGSSLLSTLLESEPKAKRVLLWVKERNHTAIERYQHYGFQREGLVDEVYCLEDIRR